MKTLKLASWNVNGIRAIIKKENTFFTFLEEYAPDILCLQETKAQREQVDLTLEGYHEYWNSAEKKGYSGTAIYTRKKPLSIHYGLGIEKHDKEGRVITAEFQGLYLVTVYTPNSKTELKRLAYRSEEWDRDFLAYVKKLESKKPVIFCGDLNVAHKEMDLANPKSNTSSPGFTPEERHGFDRIVEEGFVDTFRHFNKDTIQYTWWSYRTYARVRNAGWRIDYFCTSESLLPKLKKATIHDDVHGSDHCPVSIEISSTAL